MALFIHKTNNFFVHGVDEIKSSENKRTEQIRESLRNYIHKNNVQNSVTNEKNINILNSLLDE